MFGGEEDSVGWKEWRILQLAAALLIKSNRQPLVWTVEEQSQQRLDDIFSIERSSNHVPQGVSEDKIQAEPEQPDRLNQLLDPDEHLLLPLLIVHLGLALSQRENGLVVAAVLLGDLVAGERVPGADQEERGQAGAAGREVRAAEFQPGQGSR